MEKSKSFINQTVWTSEDGDCHAVCIKAKECCNHMHWLVQLNFDGSDHKAYIFVDEEHMGGVTDWFERLKIARNLAPTIWSKQDAINAFEIKTESMVEGGLRLEIDKIKEAEAKVAGDVEEHDAYQQSIIDAYDE
jgi:hypothetical protein